MYAEAGLMFSDFHHFYSQEVNQLEGFSHSHRSNVPMGNLVQTSTISEYDLGAEGDLFKAPEPIIGEPVLSLDPIAAAISMISCGEDVISPQTLNVADIESIQNDQLLSEIFYECKKDLLAKEAIETSLSDALDIKTPVIGTGENPNAGEKLFAEGYFHKSVSSGCLGSMELRHEAPMGPNFLDFPGMDLGAVYGMRRAFSEGDIKTLGSGNVSVIHSPVGLPQSFNSCTSEDRWQKLSRYRNKRTKRNFGRKIKYACRKALADNQPRIRGRFAKTEESDCLKKQ
ncbi:zinc finger protein CONSTANS-LIKE 9-like [Diospyros lotus]|uniref:zinc finger protein CONSTANS-LIKE 9-like n=1 Tax=Diospyros lotus TaxID=55363 RepID=UPI002251C5D9|nr:zinc finger protein CONSTANS-LIKE 9-like [Diospyros lotus]